MEPDNDRDVLLDKWYAIFTDANGGDFFPDIPCETAEEAFQTAVSAVKFLLGPPKIVNISRFFTKVENGQEEKYLDIYFIRDPFFLKDTKWNWTAFPFSYSDVWEHHIWRKNRTRKWSWLLGKY